MAKENKFVSHVAEGLSRFGIGIDSESGMGNDIHKLMLNDSTNGTGYVALARRKEASNPGKFWGEVLQGNLKNILTESAAYGEIPPAALIVPSVEAEAVIAESAKMGAKPTVFQLFDGFVIVGYKRSDIAAIIDHGKPPKAEPVEKPAKVPPKAAPEKPVSPDIPVKADSGIPSGGISPKKLAAAALLGVTLASVPFAINKLKDMPVGEAAPEARFVQNNILNESIHGTLGQPDILAALARNAPLDREEYKDLIDEGYVYDVAQNSNLPEDILNHFARSDDPVLRAAVAKNSSLKGDPLYKLAHDKEAAVRANAAYNPNMAQDALEKLGADPDSAVRSSVLGNPDISEDLLNRIEPVRTNASCENREKIYGSSCVGSSTLAYNGKNPDPCVRRGVAKNKDTPNEVLLELIKDGDPVVRRNALSNPSLKGLDMSQFFPDGWLLDGAPAQVAIRRALLENPNISEKKLREAAMYNPKVYGKSVAKNPKVGSDVASGLFNYASARGGVDGFVNEMNRLPQDEALLKEIENIQNDSTSPKKWTSSVKDRVNRSFAKNVYNPKNLINFMRADPPGAPESALTLPIVEKSKGVLRLEDLGKGGEFFEEDGKSEYALGDLDDRSFEEFFGGDENKFTPQEKAILRTADRIVNETMDELVPIIEQVMRERGVSGKTPSTPTVSVNIPEGSTSGNAGNNGSGSQNSAYAKDPLPTKLLSDRLYQNSCKGIDDLLTLF